ncbi:MAG: FAD-binding oxidoreductase [Desulfobacterales bacterium]|nr:FAD-binding oxidoreductase [Desulfobacterales bacterium]
MQQNKTKEKSTSHNSSNMNRRTFLTGMAVGAAGIWGASRWLDWYGYDPDRPPDLYEYQLDNYWFKTADLVHTKINPPLKGSEKADIVILGGGFTGLSAAFHLIQKFPKKRIVLLEGACCGYGASGRNGGFVDAGISGLGSYIKKAGPEKGRKAFDITLYGIKHIQNLATNFGLECDFEETGHIHAAMTEDEIKGLEHDVEKYKSLGLEAELLQGKDLEAEVNSPRYIAGVKVPYGGIADPFRLAQGLKSIVERLGVKIMEQSVVMRVTPGKVHHIETDMGDISAPTLVLGLNGYSHKLNFFKNRVLPLCSYVIATEPLSTAQWESIGWKNRQGIADSRVLFDYARPTVDGRIVIGGSDYPYYANDQLSSGNNKPVINRLTESLFTTFPQLEGLKIDHAWGGSMGFNIDFTPSVGQMGDHKNIYYGVAYCGEGVAFAQTAGRIIAELMAGESSEFTDFFVVNRNITYAGPEWMRILPMKLYKSFLVKLGQKTTK